MNGGTSSRRLIGRALPAALFFSVSARSADAPAGPTLADCYRKALAASENLTIADEDVNRAEAQYRELRAAVLPKLGFMGTEFYQDTTGVPNPTAGGGTFTAHHRPQYNFYASQPIFSGFREFAGLQGAGAARDAKTFDRRRAAQVLYQDVAAAFYNLVEMDQRASLLTALQKSSNDRLGELKERVRVGRSRQSELLAAHSQAASLDAQVQNAQGLQRSASELLSFLTGEKTAAVRDDTPEPAQPDDVEAFVKKAPGRPDLMSQSALLKSSSYYLTSARRGLWPTLDAEGNYYTKRVGVNKPIDWDVTFTLDAPIFRGGEWKASVDDAAAAERSQKAATSRALREAERDVRDLHARLSSSVLETQKMSEAASLAQESYQTLVKEYRLGLVTNLDVLSALSMWEQTELDYDHTRLDAKLLTVQLQVAVGDLK